MLNSWGDSSVDLCNTTYCSPSIAKVANTFQMCVVHGRVYFTNQLRHMDQTKFYRPIHLLTKCDIKFLHKLSLMEMFLEETNFY